MTAGAALASGCSARPLIGFAPIFHFHTFHNEETSHDRFFTNQSRRAEPALWQQC